MARGPCDGHIAFDQLCRAIGARHGSQICDTAGALVGAGPDGNILGAKYGLCRCGISRTRRGSRAHRKPAPTQRREQCTPEPPTTSEEFQSRTRPIGRCLAVTLCISGAVPNASGPSSPGGLNSWPMLHAGTVVPSDTSLATARFARGARRRRAMSSETASATPDREIPRLRRGHHQTGSAVTCP